MRSDRIEQAFDIASALHKEIREENTVRYHARFYSFLSYQALAEVCLALYEEAVKHNVRRSMSNCFHCPLSSNVSLVFYLSRAG